MTIDEMRNHKWVVSWSGGKDSTATIILMHEHQIPIKEIVYVRMMYDEELPATLPVMTDFVDRAKEIFEDWGYKVRIVKSIKTASEMMNKVYKKSKYTYKNGSPYGVNAFTRNGCTFTGIKTRTIEKITADYTDCYHMIGYACDEESRIHRLDEKKQSIMVELGVKEADAYDVCRKYNLLSPYYELGLKRDGCWFCPSASVRERALIKSEHPDLYHKIQEMIEMVKYDTHCFYSVNNWVYDYYTERGEKRKKKQSK